MMRQRGGDSFFSLVPLGLLLLLCQAAELAAATSLAPPSHKTSPQPARIPSLPASEFLFRRWTVEDGLPHNSFPALAQSASGHLWVGTWFEAARFDGQRFQPFSAGGMVNDFAALPDGTVWAATSLGLVRATAPDALRLAELEGFPGGKALRLAATAAGTLWIVAAKGTFRLAAGRLQPFGLLPHGQERVLALLPVGESQLWLAQPEGCFRLDDTGAGTAQTPAGAPPPPWRAAAFTGPGMLWIGTATNLWQPVAGGFRSWALPEPAAEEAIRQLAPAGPEEVWVGTSHRLLQLRDGRWRTASPVGEEWSVQSLLVDRERNLWAGVEGQGLVRVRPKQILSFTRADGLPHDQCWSVAEAPDGTIWVGTRQSLGWIKDGRAGSVPPAGELSRYPVRAVWVDGQARVWEAVDQLGLMEYREQFQFHYPALGVATGVHALHEDRSGLIWLGGEHISWWRDATSKQFHAQWPGGDPRRIRAIHEDANGAMWFGTYGDGLYRLEDGRLTRWTTREGLPSDRVWAFHEADDGTLWLGTDAGLGRLKDGRFATLTTAHGLPENVVNHILADDLGHFWISCNRGIYRVAQAELHAVADGRLARAHVRLYGEREGMPNAETNGENQPAGCKARDGRLWFPTVKGVVVLDPRDFHDTTTPPPVLIEEARADGRPLWREGVAAPGAGPLPALSTAHAHALEFHYAAVSLTAPERLRFLHRLEGLETDWQDAGTRRVANYANLPPGEYRFQVRAVNHHGYTNLAGASLPFLLTPQLHQTTAFRGGLILLALAGAGGLHAYRLRVQRRIAALERRHALELERARIARDLHDNLGPDLSQIALLGEQARQPGPGETGSQPQLDQLTEQARAAARSLSEVVWATSAKHDHLPSFVNYLADFAPELLATGNVRCFLELPAEVPPLPLEGHLRHELLLILKEALNNIVRHAHATQATLTVTLEQRTLTLTLVDNGSGFDAAEAAQRKRTSGGNGLPNLRTRAAALGATLTITSAPGQGTTVRLRMTLPD